MATTRDIGRFFVHPIWLQRATPWHHRAVTQEVDPPFRDSNSHVLHIWPLGWGLVIGWWRDTDLDEDSALMRAVWGEEADVLDEDGHLIEDYLSARDKDAARRTVAANTDGLDDEYLVAEALGLL